jgi:hypothetical protein
MKKIIFLLVYFIPIIHIQTINAAQLQKSERSIEERLSGYFQNDNIVDLLKLKTFQEIKDAMNQEFTYEKTNFDTNQKIEEKYNSWFSLAQDCKSTKIIFILLLIQNNNPQISLREFILQINAQVKASEQFIFNKIQEAYSDINQIMLSSKEHDKELVKQIKNNGHQTVIDTITILTMLSLLDLGAVDTLDQLLSIHCPEAINNGFFGYSETLLDYAIQHKKAACIPTLIKHSIKTINPTSYKHIFTTKTIENGTTKYIPISCTETHGDSPFDDESQEIYNHLYAYKLNSWTPARNSALTLTALISALVDIYTFEKPQDTKKEEKAHQKKIQQNKLKRDKNSDPEEKTEIEAQETKQTQKAYLKRCTKQINEWRNDLWNHPRNHKKLLIPLVTILGLRLCKDNVPGLNSI